MDPGRETLLVAVARLHHRRVFLIVIVGGFGVQLSEGPIKSLHLWVAAPGCFGVSWAGLLPVVRSSLRECYVKRVSSAGRLRWSCPHVVG